MIDWINLPFQINNKFQLGELEMSVLQLSKDLRDFTAIHGDVQVWRNNGRPLDEQFMPLLARAQMKLEEVRASLQTVRHWLIECQNLYHGLNQRDFDVFEYAILHNLHQAHSVGESCLSVLESASHFYSEIWVEQAYATSIIQLKRTLPNAPALQAQG